jgi:hypothetical protein
MRRTDVYGEEPEIGCLPRREKPESDNLRARIRPKRGKLPEVLCTLVLKGKSAELRDWESRAGEGWGWRWLLVEEFGSGRAEEVGLNLVKCRKDVKMLK